MKKFIIILAAVFLFGIGGGFYLSSYLQQPFQGVIADDLSLDDQEATIRAIKTVMPAVVSVIVYGQEEVTTVDLSTGEQGTATQRVEKGSGTGVLISSDGLILTNKHVIGSADKERGEYRVILNEGKQYYAQLIGKDPLKDLAVLKIFDKDLPYIELGDSSQLQVGQTVIAIGNALGRYQNSVTKGIISGLGRSLEATDSDGNLEVLDNVIQTDAEINIGNSGGPLIDLSGRMVGINVATDQGGTSIGFAITINDARTAINSVRALGYIVRPILGVRYVMLNPQLAYDNNLVRDSGALVIHPENGDPGVVPGSPADQAGLLEGDIIFEINAIKLDGINTLFSVIQRYKPGDKIGLKVQRGDKIMIKIVTLDEVR